MNKLRHKPEQIICKLRQAEVLSGHGKRVEELCRELVVSDATYYKWRKICWHGCITGETAQRPGS